MTDILLYQGYRRREMLQFLHRLCIQRHRDALLDPACAPCGDADGADCGDDLGDHIADWYQLIITELNGVIMDIKHRNPGYPVDDRFESQAMALFIDPPATTRGLAKVIAQLCADLAAGRDRRCDAILWQVLSQYFKAEMDRSDGAEAGTHRLKTRRRIDRLRKDLEERGGTAFASIPDAATALQTEIAASHLTNMPSRQTTIEDYLWELAVDGLTTGDEEIDRDPLLLDFISTPEQELAVQQCVDRLPPELRQALSIKGHWNGEPVFLRSEHMAAHYGFGWETVRKRARAAEDQLRDCLEV